MSDTNRIHKCHCCGWEWVHGQYGGHDCSVKLQERIKELEGQLLFLVNNDSINDSSIELEVLMMLAPDK